MYRSSLRLTKIDTSAIDHGLLVSAESKIYLSGKVPRYYGHKVSKLSRMYTVLDVAHLLFVGKIPDTDQSIQFSCEFSTNLSRYYKQFVDEYCHIYNSGLHPSSTLGIVLKLGSIQLINTNNLWDPILHYGFCTSILSNYRKYHNKVTHKQDKILDTPQCYNEILCDLFVSGGNIISEFQLKLLHSLLIVYADHGFSTPTYISRLAISEQNNLTTSIATAALCHESLNPMIEYHEFSRFVNDNPDFIKGIHDFDVSDNGLPRLLSSCQSSFLDPRNCILMQLWHNSRLKSLVEKLIEKLKPRHYLKSDFILLMILQDIYSQLGNEGLIDLHLFQTFITLARVPGWISHCLEQRNVGRRIEHVHAYVGPIVDD
ncbi:hypothetical protein BMR1_01G02310 [Babesia microti strain RI]|uniref:Citrate synthase n=1 Tax=Babesia microti (strain RI) TaxID=1133968 RepID=A0A1N6LWY0_BABMR|nr:hypothetical protein BMR1_01G02310 [Babesia microti strain RI]SIO73371.1 hypothetical protein BMR1_01G02310 [Babesia microti strain RI]|eukprot:XP_021337472.1 hypothetical protein BMR1_01G02310 [Babesia microti strain RI]